MQVSEDKIVGFLRVNSGAIKPFEFKAQCTPPVIGEVLEHKLNGDWDDRYEDPRMAQAASSYEKYPMSLHVTIPCGKGVIPCVGDYVKVTIETAIPEEMRKMMWPDFDGNPVFPIEGTVTLNASSKPIKKRMK